MDRNNPSEFNAYCRAVEFNKHLSRNADDLFSAALALVEEMRGIRMELNTIDPAVAFRLQDLDAILDKIKGE